MNNLRGKSIVPDSINDMESLIKLGVQCGKTQTMVNFFCEKTDFISILRERNFPLSFRDFGRIVGYSAHWLRELYRNDQKRFFDLLDDAAQKWQSICK